MRRLYHIAKSDDWDSALKTGEYRVGSLHRSFEKDGFIHLAYAPQVNVIADLIYSNTPDLKLLTIDPLQLTSEVVEEKAEYPEEYFPHLYGPLNVGAVIDVIVYKLMPDGKFPRIDSK